jgi:hypothetical protein
MKNIFSWISLIGGAIPGIAIILDGFGTPAGLRMPFGIVAAVCGFVAFGVVLLIRERIKRQTKKALPYFIIFFGLVSFISFSLYWIVLNQCVFRAPQHSEVFFPLWLEGNAKERVDSAGGRIAFYDKYGPGAVWNLLETQTTETNLTALLLLSLISTASLAVAVASGVASAFTECHSATASSSKRQRDPPDSDRKKLSRI